MEPIAPCGKHSFQWKPYTLVGAVRFRVNCFLSFQCKPFLQRKSLAFSRSYSFYWKPFILVQAMLFSFFRKAFVFGENHCRQLKPIFLEEAYSFQQKHGGSCFCFNIFTSRSYQKLPEYLNINDSVRSLKMANLSSIHIPGKVLQNSEGYQNLAEHLLCKVFNTPLGLYFYTVYVLLELQHDH